MSVRDVNVKLRLGNLLPKGISNSSKKPWTLHQDSRKAASRASQEWQGHSYDTNEYKSINTSKRLSFEKDFPPRPAVHKGSPMEIHVIVLGSPDVHTHAAVVIGALAAA